MKLSAMNGTWRFYSIDSAFESYRKNGFQTVELWTGAMHAYVDPYTYDIQEAKDAMQKHGLRIVTICPEQTNPKPYNIASKRTDMMVSYYENIISVAKEFQAERILVTPGWGYLDEPFEKAYERSVEMMKQIGRMASQANVELVCEALQEDESNLVNTATQLKQYLDDVDCQSLHACIDMGAMARCNETIQDYFDVLKDEVHHVHLVDGKPTGHLAFHDGTRDLKQDLNDLAKNGYQGYLTLECVNSRYFMKPWEADEKNARALKEIEEAIQCEIF